MICNLNAAVFPVIAKEGQSANYSMQFSERITVVRNKRLKMKNNYVCLEFRVYEDLDSASSFQYLCDWYFGVIAPMKLKKRTIENNRKLIEGYVLPRIGGMRICDITTCRIDVMLSELLREGGLKCGGPLSPGSVNLIRACIGTVFSVAVKKGIIEQNPVTGSTPARKSETEKGFLDTESCRIIISRLGSIHNSQVARAVELLLYTGLRRGELLGLSWEDIDLEKAEIHVRHTLWKEELTTPKTRSSVRMIPLSEEAVSCISEQYKYISSQKELMGEQWTETGAVFINRHGGHMNGEYLNNMFRQFLKDNGFNGMHIHDLRHANASILINNGVPMKVVSEHLGHSSVKTTEDYYTHLFASSKRITAEAMSRALGS